MPSSAASALTQVFCGPTLDSAPTAALKAMPSGSISLRWETFPLGPGGALLGVHVYCVPPKGTGRDTIGPGSSIAPSPFFCEVWEQKPLQRLCRVGFTEDGDLSQLDQTWVDSRRKSVPVLRLRFGVGDVGEWKFLSFPHGLSKPAVVQSFAFAENSHFDPDSQASGKLAPSERWTNDAGKEYRAVYRFDGERFVDDKAVWFVLGPTVKTRAEAEQWLARHPQGHPELIETRQFSGLKPGFWAVVFERCQDRAYADSRAKALSVGGVSAYAKKVR